MAVRVNGKRRQSVARTSKSPPKIVPLTGGEHEHSAQARHGVIAQRRLKRCQCGVQFCSGLIYRRRSERGLKPFSMWKVVTFKQCAAAAAIEFFNRIGALADIAELWLCRPIRARVMECYKMGVDVKARECFSQQSDELKFQFEIIFDPMTAIKKIKSKY